MTWRASVRRLGQVVALLLGGATLEAQPGVTSAVRTVSMSATRTSALSVAILSGATQTLASITDNAINPFATPVRVTTSWSVAPGTNSVRLLAYFSNAAQALANGSVFLASARMQGRVLTSPTTLWQPVNWTSFTQNGAFGVGTNGATLRLMWVPITGANLTGSRTMDLNLRLNLTGQPATTPGLYSGTITLRAFTT
jgi:hypothetical protein